MASIRCRGSLAAATGSANLRILAVIPVVDYPVHGDTHVPEHAQDTITALFEGMDWTI